MSGKELAEYCNNTECEKCEYQNSCENFTDYISQYTPCSLLRIENIKDDIFKQEF